MNNSAAVNLCITIMWRATAVGNAAKLVAAVKTFQTGEELAAKDAAEDFIHNSRFQISIDNE